VLLRGGWNIFVNQLFPVNELFRIRTVKGRSYLYRQTSVREGKKVRSIMEYCGRVDGRDPPQRTTNRNSDLQATQNPKRPDYTEEHRRGLFKTDKAEFDRLHAMDAARAKSAKESKAAWKEKNMSRPEKQERAQAKQASGRHKASRDYGPCQGFQ
jgi:hypothetical protein